MTISTSEEFVDQAASVLGSAEPVLVTREGSLAGVYFPCPEANLPVELTRELFAVLSATVKRQIEAGGLTEDEILEDFADWRKRRREARR